MLRGKGHHDAGKEPAAMRERNGERRKSQRVEAALKMEVQVPLVDGTMAPASLESINISTSGVYFRSSHFIEPMTKLAMELELPLADDRPRVPCEGIVVRVTPEEESASCEEYEIAVFFTGIEPQGLRQLEAYISRIIAPV
jgi:hypothetical protein